MKLLYKQFIKTTYGHDYYIVRVNHYNTAFLQDLFNQICHNYGGVVEKITTFPEYVELYINLYID